jgi:hypothetical protein
MLTHAVQVEVRGGGEARWWETIAAFDVEDAANNYAAKCRHSTGYRYRVVPYTGGTESE